MSAGKILLVEDDESLGFVTKDNLEESGFEVDWAKNGSEGVEQFTIHTYDLCVLDVMMPNMDGFSLASHIRTKNEFIPILFLTARVQEEDRLKGFEIGGDDYITKPYSMDELIYRIKVFLRRSSKVIQKDTSDEKRTIGSFDFDCHNLLLENNQVKNSLTKMECELLRTLDDSRNELVTREEILVKIWGENDYFKGRSLDVFISRLRKYMASDENIKIQNHHGVGFTLLVSA